MSCAGAPLQDIVVPTRKLFLKFRIQLFVKAKLLWLCIKSECFPCLYKDNLIIIRFAVFLGSTKCIFFIKRFFVLFGFLMALAGLDHLI